jgi:hypothetical protein
MAVYLDSSALVKLVVREAESAALRRFLRSHPIRVSSALARVEVTRAVRSQGTGARLRAQAVLSRVRLLQIDDDILSTAAQLEPGVMRSLDAIHLASARVFGAEMEALVTYDTRMRDAAAMLGFAVVAPT